MYFWLEIILSHFAPKELTISLVSSCFIKVKHRSCIVILLGEYIMLLARVLELSAIAELQALSPQKKQYEDFYAAHLTLNGGHIPVDYKTLCLSCTLSSKLLNLLLVTIVG